jgi:hypothetical protein
MMRRSSHRGRPAACLSFQSAHGVCTLRALACMLDSLVRVSRRVDGPHFGRTGPRAGSTRELYGLTSPADRGQSTSSRAPPGTPPAQAWRPGTAARTRASAFLTPHCGQSLPFQQVQALFTLSFQRSFHLSFTVLVRYRSPASI